MVIPDRLTDPTPVPEIPRPVQWGDLGRIIGEYDEALTNCNGDKAGIRAITIQTGKE